MTTPANLRGWGQGWPIDRSDDMRRVAAAQSGADFDVHYEIAPLVKFLIDQVERRGYLIDHGKADVDDDWSYANRPIRGRNSPSNHSWGLAIDIDAQEFPLGSYRRLPQWVIDLFTADRFDYGGDWSGRKDPMHLEFNGTPREARWLVASLAGHHAASTPAPVPPTVPAPTPPVVPSPTQPYRVPEEEMDKIIKRAGKDQFWFRESNGKTGWISKAQADSIRASYLKSNAPCPLVELPDNAIKELGMVLPK